MKKNNEECTCGQTHVVYCPDDNQSEPACWECWHRDNYVTYDKSIEWTIRPVIHKNHRVIEHDDDDLPF
jgi:hypothetical protein